MAYASQEIGHEDPETGCLIKLPEVYETYEKIIYGSEHISEKSTERLIPGTGFIIWTGINILSTVAIVSSNRPLFLPNLTANPTLNRSSQTNPSSQIPHSATVKCHLLHTISSSQVPHYGLHPVPGAASSYLRALQ
jgi:hypothetical protein